MDSIGATMGNGQVTEFRVGAVLARSLGVLRNNIVPFGVLSVMFMAVPFVLTLMLVPLFAGLGAGAGVGILPVVLIWILMYFMLSAVLMYGTISDLRGKRATIGESLRWVLGLVFPIVGITIVATLGIFAGVMLLVVPGLILLTMWWVAVPAAVVERTGVGASLRRSTELTSGYRWPVFGVFITVYVVQMLLEFVANRIFGGIEFLETLVSFVISLFVIAFYAVVSAVSYHDLRVLKDGVDVDDIARVFD
jgi:hypothetical protein